MQVYQIEVEAAGLVCVSTTAPVTFGGSSSTAPRVNARVVVVDGLPFPQVKTVQDLTMLTRQMKEAWVFGQVDTLGPSEAEARTEEHTRAVAERLSVVLQNDGTERGT